MPFVQMNEENIVIQNSIYTGCIKHRMAIPWYNYSVVFHRKMNESSKIDD